MYHKVSPEPVQVLPNISSYNGSSTLVRVLPELGGPKYRSYFGIIVVTGLVNLDRIAQIWRRGGRGGGGGGGGVVVVKINVFFKTLGTRGRMRLGTKRKTTSLTAYYYLDFYFN